MGEKNETLGRRIARLRLEHGMTQESLAGRLGVTAQAVSKWENDLSAPDISLLSALARTLDVTVDELLGSGKPEPPAGLPEPAKVEPGPVVQDGARPRKLHLHVESADGDDVNINVPLGMASAVLKVGSKFPGAASLDVDGTGIDPELLVEAVKHGEKGTLLEVDTGDGDHVTISLE
ncbi:helix-turn-helix domain-containing protein [Olsenella profusa]|uniref:Helix-turn-helix domain-containing protein n=1 Tax=Olsenella profusa TaxID=138595 RepID=A0ABS2F2X4_9ACTN|nr:helix-turn-helix transcriptional regulator [Olsenella profusa]MBM6774908.1 helix-turn-helix domain-containing protein [Olsenella profusa]